MFQVIPLSLRFLKQINLIEGEYLMAEIKQAAAGCPL